MDTERTKLQKAILIILLAMAVVFAIITGVVRSHKGITFESGLLYPDRREDCTVWSGRIEAEDVTVTTRSEGALQVVELKVGELIDHTYRVEYPGGVIRSDLGDYRRLRITKTDAYGREELLFDGGCNPGASFAEFCDPEGNPDLLAGTRYVTNAGLWHNYELQPSQVMRLTEGEPLSCRGSWAFYLFVLFCSLIVAADVAFPELFFELKYRMSVQDPEPTDLYLSIQKAAWVILTVLLLGFYLWGITRMS